MESVTTFLPALAGGLLIGLSSLILYAGIGRIAGISGITFGLFWGVGSERRWRSMFILGLVLGAWLAVLLGASLPVAALPASTVGVAMMVLAGLLVGFGTRLGNGCTSGHGVCGIARLSSRSLVAVFTFMAVGMLVASLLRPLLK
jgi:uncharacterized protein